MGMLVKQENSSRGFSLASVMVGVAIVGIVALGSLSLFENMSKSQNMADFRTQRDVLVEEIRAHLSDTQACKATFGGISLLTNGHSEAITQIKNADNTAKWITATPYSSNTYRISSLVFNYAPGTSASQPSTATANLMVQLQAIKKVAGVNVSDPKFINISIKRNPTTGAMLECIASAKMSDGIWQRAPVVTDIFYSGGNVGIGTNDPKSPLHVWSGIATSSPGAAASNVLQMFVEAPDTGVINYGHLGGTAGGRLDLRSENVARMTMTNLGKVGIGTTDPMAQLDVTGEIKISQSSMACAPTLAGSIRYDSVAKSFEGCDGTSWKPLGGGLGNTCHWVTSNVDCTTGATPHQASCPPGEYVNQVRTTQICYIADNTYTTISDLYCCK